MFRVHLQKAGSARRATVISIGSSKEKIGFLLIRIGLIVGKRKQVNQTGKVYKSHLLMVLSSPVRTVLVSEGF